MATHSYEYSFTVSLNSSYDSVISFDFFAFTEPALHPYFGFQFFHMNPY